MTETGAGIIKFFCACIAENNDRQMKIMASLNIDLFYFRRWLITIKEACARINIQNKPDLLGPGL